VSAVKMLNLSMKCTLWLCSFINSLDFNNRSPTSNNCRSA